MQNLLRKLFDKIQETHWKFKKTNSDVRIRKGGRIKLGKNIKINNTTIFVDDTSQLEIGDNVILDNVGLYVTNQGILTIGANSILEKERNSWVPEFICNHGTIKIADHVLAKPQRIWVRFGGLLTIGKYTNINCGSEIRCDERVDIGEFIMISYNTRIWDTNTHQQLSKKEREQRTINYYPSFGKEIEKPKTKPVSISNNCWIGEGACILKGTNLGSEVTVGFNTVIIGRNIEPKTTVVQKLELNIFKTIYQ